MSAPQKIWAHGLCMGALGRAATSVASYRHGSWETRHGDANYASLYHHDDVVRELSGVAEEACGDFREWLAGATPGCCVVPGSLLRLEAALAKIAQEG